MTRADAQPAAPPARLLRWSDYLTRRSCALRIDDADADAPLNALVSKYLVNADAARLVAERRLLAAHAPTLEAIRDAALALDDDGSSGGVTPGVVFRSDAREMRANESPPSTTANLRGEPVGVMTITIDRSEAGYSRNWAGFDRRRWGRSESAFMAFVDSAVIRDGDDGCPDPRRLRTREERVAFLHRLARAVWESPFENYSRFTGDRLAYKTGDEALANIMDGRGAICSEKVRALKFVTDRFRFESRFLFAGPDAAGALPAERLRHVLDTFDFRGAAPAMRYWQHMALEYQIDGERILVDATNGNIPFLFMRGDDADAILHPERPRPIRVRMGVYDENFYYHRAPDDLALDLCYAMENLIPEIDLVQVFDNELGLAITREFLVAPMPYRTEAEFDDLVGLYETLTAPDGLPFDASAEWEFAGEVSARFAELEPQAARLILDSRDYLTERFAYFEDERREMGLAVVRLRAG